MIVSTVCKKKKKKIDITMQRIFTMFSFLFFCKLFQCFNMKLENARALRTNMAEGMTPLLDRLPSQGCDGLAALTLVSPYLDLLFQIMCMGSVIELCLG